MKSQGRKFELVRNSLDKCQLPSVEDMDRSTEPLIISEDNPGHPSNVTLDQNSETSAEPEDPVERDTF